MRKSPLRFRPHCHIMPFMDGRIPRLWENLEGPGISSESISRLRGIAVGTVTPIGRTEDGTPTGASTHPKFLFLSSNRLCQPSNRTPDVGEPDDVTLSAIVSTK